MARERLLKAAGSYARSFISENGKHYRREHQELQPVMDHVKYVRHMHDTATRISNPNEWRHLGTVPMALLIDWLNKNGFTIDQWARNDGGIPGKRYPESKSGVKDKFLAFFLSRDYSKLHNMHVTTKRESSQIFVPNSFKRSIDEHNQTQ